MRVLALGGAGAMGRAALMSVADRPPWSHLTIADRDEMGARDVAAALPAATGRRVDATDSEELRELLAEHDVVVSTIGPYYRFGDSVLALAIEAGTHYIDICDDWQPTQTMLGRNADAVAADVTAVIGAGASPGMSNLLAVVAAQQLDDVRKLFTGWGTAGLGLTPEGGGADQGAATAAYEHWIAQCTGTIPVRHDYADTQIRPLRRVVVDLPGTGRITEHTVGHPEPVTLPLVFPALQECMNLMDLPSGLVDVLRRERDRVEAGERTVRDAAWRVKALDGGPHQWRSPLLPVFLRGVVRDVLTRRRFAPELYALAVGEKAGRPTTVMAALERPVPGGMAAMTGVPLAIVLAMLADGSLTRRGVMAPEACVDPGVFFDRLAPHTVGGESTPVVRLDSDDPRLSGPWAAVSPAAVRT